MNHKKWPLIAILLLAWTVSVTKSVASQMGNLKGSRPNVIFFLGDDQSRFDHTAYGNPAVPTPTTDAFSKEALVFDKAFTGQAICAPSRSILNTGLYPIRNGCFINHSKIRKGVKTLPQYLQELGYTVILAGKSHVGPESQFPWSKRFLPVDKGLARDWIPIEAIDAFLADPGPDPFCILVASSFPHPPYIMDTPYQPDDTVLPPFIAKSDKSQRNATLYYRNIQEKEAEFAALLAAIDKHGMRDNSLVLYSDDHGLFRGKFTTYDSGLNVAFMVRWPERVKPGHTDALISFADFVPTMIELAGGTAPSDLDGKSLLPVLENGGGKHHDYVYGVTVNQGIIARHVFPQRSVHDGRYHYIHNFNTMERIERERAAGKEVDYFLERGAAGHENLPEEMLFDTQKDPHEMTNVAQNPEMAQIKKRLQAELFRWMRTQNDYLTEKGPVPFLEVGKRFGLDHMDNKYPYAIPAEKVGSLKGKTIHPHNSTSPK